MALDPAEFRKVLGQFATGVAVVTTEADGKPQAMTVNSFTSVSLDPPLVLFCADKRTRTNDAVQKAQAFAVNFLRDEQRPISDLFAGKGTDDERIRELSHQKGETGSPLIPGALAWLECALWKSLDAGDHVVYLGLVVSAHRGELGAPLLFYRGSYQGLREAWRWADRASANEGGTRFDEMVDFFDRMQTESPFGELLADFARFCAPAAGELALDVGCGPGRLVRELAGTCQEAIGVDIAEAMVSRAKRRALDGGLARTSFQVGKLEELNFGDRWFDLVSATNVVYLQPDPVAGLRELLRVCKRGGRIALLNPATQMNRPAMNEVAARRGWTGFAAEAMYAWAGAAEANRPYDEARLESELAAAGFEAVRHQRVLDDLAMFTAAKRPDRG